MANKIKIAHSSSGQRSALLSGTFKYNASASANNNHWLGVARAKDASVANKMVKIALSGIGNKHVKYSDHPNLKNTTGPNVKYDFSKLKRGATSNCSNFVLACVKGALGISGNKPYDGGAVHMKKALQGTDGKYKCKDIQGKFTFYTGKEYVNGSKLLPGDILWCRHNRGGGHTIIITSVNGSSTRKGGTTTTTTTKTITKTISGADAILKACDELAWPLGTPKSKWKSPTSALKKWLNATLPHRRWGRKYGASCDKAVFCAIRKSGYDNKVEKNLEQQIKPSRWNKKKWQLVQGGKHTKLDRSKFRAGDVIITDRPGNGGHIYIIYKNGGRSNQIIAEGSYTQKNHLHLVRSKGELHNPPGPLGNWHWRPIGGAVYEGDYGADYGAEGGLDDGRALVLENSISQLYSTDNYKWVDTEKEESEEAKRLKQYQQSLKDFLSNIDISDNKHNVAPVDVNVSYSAIRSSKQSIFKLDKLKSATSTQSLISYPSLVEAPVIELSFNGITIGGYGNSGDKYPNYISSMSVKKINGRINTYTINVVYQVRAGEDPNFIDKLISNTGYLKPLKIIYGDANSPGTIFKEESAVITDVKSQDSVSSSQINYTISAISSVTSADKTYYSFSQKTDKPSNIINNLLYNSGEVSTQLQAAFPKMTDKNFVTSNNLIPNNDSVVTVGGMADVSPLTYLTHVVSCMSNVANSTSYFLTFNDSKEGAYFNITEVAPIMDSNVLYEVDVGYPGSNFVTNFQLCDNIYWPLVYEYNGSISKWEYDIDNYGNINTYRTNSLHTDNKYLASSIINSNWWKSLTEFPISAKLTLKGLTIPVMLMTYIRVNTLFYGQKDIASGIYVVTDQEDSISGNGYSTTLTLLRVSD